MILDDMEVRVQHYFPEHIAQMEEFKNISAIYDKYLKLAWAAAERTESNRILSTMDSGECLYWEKLFKIKSPEGESLTDRINRIKSLHLSDLPYTEKKLNTILAGVCGEKNYKLLVTPESYSVVCNISLESVPMIAIVSGILRRIVPANMTVEVKIIYNRHREFKKYTHAQLNRYTHAQLRNSTDFNEE